MTEVPETLIYPPTAELAARALLQAKAYLFAEVMTPAGFFEWKSGVKAPVYTDCRVVQGHPGPFRTLVQALVNSIENSFPSCRAIAGMAEAGTVWSITVAMQLGLPHASVRKTMKEYGRGRMIEGNLGPGDRVVLVDDLMAGGGTAAAAITRIESETGAHVVGVQTIVNWNFVAMRQRFAKIGVPYRALVSYPQILDAAVELGTISKRAARELSLFYKNPAEHKWELENLLPEPADPSVREVTESNGGVSDATSS